MSERIEPVAPRAGVAPVELQILTPVERELERERRERRRRQRPAQAAPPPSGIAPGGGGLDIRA